MTPVMRAVLAGHEKLTRILLFSFTHQARFEAMHRQQMDHPYLADINISTPSGRTALSWAGARFRPRKRQDMGTKRDREQSLTNLVVKELVGAGADPNVTRNNNDRNCFGTF